MRIIDGIKVVLVLKCVVHVVLFGDGTESKLHSVSVSEQSQHKLWCKHIWICNLPLAQSTFWWPFGGKPCVFKFNELKLLDTSAAHNYMKQRAKNQP